MFVRVCACVYLCVCVYVYVCVQDSAQDLLIEYLSSLRDTRALPLPEWNPDGIVVVGGPPCQVQLKH